MRSIKGVKYVEYPNGVLVPASLVCEAPIKIRTPKDVLPLLESDKWEAQERFIVITLDGNNQVIKKHTVTVGLVNCAQMHPRETYYPAISDMAVSIIVAHNHPSGNLEPSEADLVATRRLVEVSKTMGIPVLDHLIISKTGFLSLRERFPNYFT